MVVLASGLALSGPAHATDAFTLDTSPDSFAGEAVNAAGTGFFAWEHRPPAGDDTTMFCRVARGGTCGKPIVLPAAPLNPAPFDSAQVSAAFPVLGGGSTVYVVGARFLAQDVVVWTSSDGGQSFGPAVQVAQSGAYRGSNPSEVLAAGAGFDVSSHNPGLFFLGVPATGAGPASGADLAPLPLTTAGSTLGLAGGGPFANPVEAFTLLNGATPSTIDFTRYTGGPGGAGDPNDPASWSAPAVVTTGVLPSLAGGPSGLFLASQDYDATGRDPRVDVRRYTGSGFGAPVTVQNDTPTDNAGRLFQTPGGRLLVAWRGPERPDGVSTIRLYVSGDRGASFTAVGDVAAGTPNYVIGVDSIRLAAADDGQGFVSFLDQGGGTQTLRVADLTPATSRTAPPPPPVLGRSVDATTVSGTVYVLLPGTGHVAHASAAKGTGFVPLTQARQLPVGTIFDTTAGAVRLTSATARRGQVQTGNFTAGLFSVLQNRRERGVTELRLVDPGSTSKTCVRVGKAHTAAKRTLPQTVLTLLRATANGRFRTRGRYSSATVRGTIWTTTDRCDGTLTTVQRGVVAVTDFRRRRLIVLRAGRSYLAPAP